ncbi:MAG: hypothetical protein ABIV51_05805, partial [Saprospiraceae bacterium]
MNRSLIAQVLSTFILSISCILSSFGQAAFEKDLQRKLIMAEEGETIEIPAGTFQCSKTLSLDGKKKIRIKGAGMDKTQLS